MTLLARRQSELAGLGEGDQATPRLQHTLATRSAQTWRDDEEDGDLTPKSSSFVGSPVASRAGSKGASRPASAVSRPVSASPVVSVAERCRAAAAVEVLKASKVDALSGAIAALREPLASLDGLEGLPPHLVRRCQVTMRGEESLKLVPDSLRHEWSTGALDQWKERAMKGFCPASSSSHKARARREARRQRPRVPSGGRSTATSSRKSTRESFSSVDGKSVAEFSNPADAAFALLENMVRALRPIAPCGTLQRTIVDLVHGVDVGLPPSPVVAELRRVVPRPGELEGNARWVLLEEILASLDLERQFDMTSVMHAEIPEAIEVCRRPASASAIVRPTKSRNEGGMTFPQAFKGKGDQKMRITAGSCAPWAVGQAPRSPRTGEVPGPGFYQERSLQRSVCNPRSGEFASVGKPRTRCPVNTLSVASRFGYVDTSRPSSATSRRPLRRPASAPGLLACNAARPSQWPEEVESHRAT